MTFGEGEGEGDVIESFAKVDHTIVSSGCRATNIHDITDLRQTKLPLLLRSTTNLHSQHNMCMYITHCTYTASTTCVCILHIAPTQPAQHVYVYYTLHVAHVHAVVE